MAKYSPETRERLMKNETSIRAVVPFSNGHVVTLGFPGLAFDIQGEAFIDPERFHATMDAPDLEPCQILIVLVETDEVPEEGWALLKDKAADKSFRLELMPIEDYQVPDQSFMARWAVISTNIDACLAEGGTVALSCHYGAGRSGTMAARLLMDRGYSMQQAVDALRSRFPESIESKKQIEWLEQDTDGSDNA
nr:hypothetical protein [uncultured Cohaesibacter sp.]